MKTKYALFKVYNYKGGELYSLINLSKESLIANLSETFEGKDEIYDDEDEILAKDALSIAINNLISDKYEFFSLYAAGDGFTGNIYKVENSEMTLMEFEDFTQDIIDYIDTNWRD